MLTLVLFLMVCIREILWFDDWGARFDPGQVAVQLARVSEDLPATIAASVVHEFNPLISVQLIVYSSILFPYILTADLIEIEMPRNRKWAAALSV